MNDLTALIPLDTTQSSESALQLLPLLKEMNFNRVRLVSVSDSKKNNMAREALDKYLQRHASTVSDFGMTCETRVLDGNPVDAILAEANPTDISLIVIATHGRTGISRLRLGSVGEKLIKNSVVPRLVIGPNVEIDLSTYDLTHVVVPIDGSELSELAIPIARYIARQCDAQIDLIRTVSPSNAVAADGMGVVDTLTPIINEAESYLSRIEESFDGLVVTKNVLTGSASEAILQHMRNSTNDLVVMASKGRTGLTRAIMGSTTERVLAGPDPVLIFEPNEDHGRLFQIARAS